MGFHAQSQVSALALSCGLRSEHAVHFFRFYIVTSEGDCCLYALASEVTVGSGTSDADQARVVVVDGNKAKITAMRQCVIPPPMCAIEVEMQANIDQV